MIGEFELPPQGPFILGIKGVCFCGNFETEHQGKEALIDATINYFDQMRAQRLEEMGLEQARLLQNKKD